MLRTYEALAQAYAAEAAGRPAKPVEVSGVEADLLRNVRAVCEWRLGRGVGPVAIDNAPSG